MLLLFYLLYSPKMKNSSLTFFSLFAAVLIFSLSFFEGGKERTPKFNEPNIKAESGVVFEGGSFTAFKEENPQIDIYSDIAVVYDTNKNKILFQKNAFKQTPIASLTKLMTALVFLEIEPDLAKLFDILPSENVGGSTLYLKGGEFVSLKDLFYSSIVGSANNATLALTRASGMPKNKFVEEMNRKAISFNLESTYFKDPTGLDSENVSSAYDIARLAKEAFKNEIIRTAASQNEYYLIVRNTGREHTIKNPNKLLDENAGIGASKTGFLYEAGYCIVAQSSQKKNIIVVVLGSESKEANFADVRKLMNYFEQ